MQFAHFSASFFQFSTLRKWSQGQKNFCIKMVWRQDKAAALKMGILIKYYPISMFALVLRENKSHKNQHLKKFNSIQPKTFKTTQFLRSQLLGSLKLFPECLYFFCLGSIPSKCVKKCDKTKSTIMMIASIIYYSTEGKQKGIANFNLYTLK